METASTTASASRIPPGQPRVLLVEDNEDTQFLLKTLLEDTCTLNTLSTAEQAQAAISEDVPYQLVLLDINLGSGKSGADFITDLRAHPDYHDVPVVALTAYALPGDREKFESMGFTSYLAKPFKVDDLIELIETLLRR